MRCGITSRLSFLAVALLSCDICLCVLFLVWKEEVLLRIHVCKCVNLCYSRSLDFSITKHGYQFSHGMRIGGAVFHYHMPARRVLMSATSDVHH